MEKYKFRKYDKNFSKLYTREKSKLNKLFFESIHIEHIGSTAVNGLRGKGIIDILVGVPKNKLAISKTILKNSKYIFKINAGSKNRFFFVRDYSYNKKLRRVHLHLVVYNTKDWIEPIAVRDFLRKHPEEIMLYEKIKKKAVKIANGNGEIYRKFKDDYLKGLVRLAIFQ